MSDTLDLFAQASLDPTERWCPICHAVVQIHEGYDLVPVCPNVYPGVSGFYVHDSCLASEREQDIYILRDRPRNLFFATRTVR